MATLPPSEPREEGSFVRLQLRYCTQVSFYEVLKTDAFKKENARLTTSYKGECGREYSYLRLRHKALQNGDLRVNYLGHNYWVVRISVTQTGNIS